MPPQPRYARTASGLHIAYETVGEGPLDLLLVDQWFSNVDALWDFEPLAHLVTQLATFSRVILFDKRGTGLSDPVALEALPTLEGWADDVRAVLDAVGSKRAAMMSGVGAAPMLLAFAATYPDQTSALVLVDPFAKIGRTEDYPIGLPAERLPADLERIRSSWGVGGGTMTILAPNLLADTRLAERYQRYERQSASPGAARAMIAALYENDVRAVLPAIRVPALIIHHADATRITPASGRYIAERIPNAKYVEVPGADNYIWAGDPGPLIAEAQEFLTGVRPAYEPDRVLATVLFTDIVASTARAVELGDAAWRALLAEHHRAVRLALERFRGHEIAATGDGFLATFDGPARAIRCAFAIGDAVRDLGLTVRAGLHTGEIELTGGEIAGIAVHIAARISALAGAGEVLVSSTVKDLVAGAGLAFEPLGLHALKGVPDEWAMFRVVGR